MAQIQKWRARILLAAALVGHTTVASAQAVQVQLRVDGTPIVASRPATRAGDEWFVPLAPIAAALGADLTLSADMATLRVLRRDGIVAEYDARTRQIRQGYMLLGELNDTQTVPLTGGLESILFPLGGIVALFGVSARYDNDRDTIEIESSAAAAGGGAGRPPAVQLASQQYLYSLTSDGNAYGQFAQIQGQALVGRLRVSDTLLLNQAPGEQLPQVRQATLRVELEPRRLVTFGDQGASIGIDGLASSLRGVGYEDAWGSVIGDVYAGRAVSSVRAAFGSSGLADYDTTFFGFSTRRASRRSSFVWASSLFDGPSRKGASTGLAITGDRAGQRFKLQGVVGRFTGESPRQSLEQTTQHVDGVGYGVSVTDTTSVKNHLLLGGAWEHYSPDFLTVRDDAQFSGVSRSTASATLRATSSISVSAGASDSESLLDGHDRNRSYTYGANASAPISVPLQFGYFRSIQTGDAYADGGLTLTQYSVLLPRASRFAGTVFYSELRTGGVTTHSVTAQGSVDFRSLGRLGVNDQEQPGTSRRYGIDWSRQLGRDGFIRLGVDRLEQSGQAPLITPVVAGNIPLPWNQRLQVTYIADRTIRTFQVQVGGPLWQHRALTGVDGAMTMVLPVSLGGQVYQDANLDGRFDPAADRAIADLRVWLDERQSAITDSSGYFRFEGVTPGTHRLRAELTTLAANLIFRDGETRMVAAMPYGANRQDFPAIPTGQVAGAVTVTSLTGTEREPLNQPFPDARIVASGGRESFSEANGAFVLADLPPGVYELRVDPASIPAGFEIAPPSRTVTVVAGQTVRGAVFQIARSVIRK